MRTYETVLADITTLHVDAVVNAANSSLLGGGGVDGAIHRASGPQLLQACRELGGCPTGDAKATPAFRLHAKWIFHAVGPVWNGGRRNEDALLASCYQRCMQLAQVHACASIAFPAISTGIYRFPPQRAAEIAVRTARETLPDGDIERVIFCCFNAEAEAIYRALLV